MLNGLPGFGEGLVSGTGSGCCWSFDINSGTGFFQKARDYFLRVAGVQAYNFEFFVSTLFSGAELYCRARHSKNTCQVQYRSFIGLTVPRGRVDFQYEVSFSVSCERCL